MNRSQALLAPVLGGAVAASIHHVLKSRGMWSVERAYVLSALSAALSAVLFYTGHAFLSTVLATAAVFFLAIPLTPRIGDYLKTAFGLGWGRINGKLYILGTNAAGLIVFAVPIALFLLAASR